MAPPGPKPARKAAFNAERTVPPGDLRALPGPRSTELGSSLGRMAGPDARPKGNGHAPEKSQNPYSLYETIRTSKDIDARTEALEGLKRILEESNEKGNEDQKINVLNYLYILQNDLLPWDPMRMKVVMALRRANDMVVGPESKQ